MTIERDFVHVANLDDVPFDSVKVVSVDTLSLLIVRTNDGLHAIANRCSHAEEPLECGRVKYGWIACPAHGARFDLETGEALNPPATAPIATFAVRVVGDRIEVAV